MEKGNSFLPLLPSVRMVVMRIDAKSAVDLKVEIGVWTMSLPAIKK
jgi:hypothetical protein